MDNRLEPRFEIYAQGRVTLLDSPEKEFDCLLLDISASGLKLVADQSLSIDQIIGLELEDHVVLANVRYVQPRGNKYTVGAERIHAVAKASLPRDKAKCEQLYALVKDFHSRIRAGIEAEVSRDYPAARHAEAAALDHQIASYLEKRTNSDGAGVPSSEPGQTEMAEQIVEAVVQRIIEHLDKAPDGAKQGRTLKSEIVERLLERLEERRPLWQPSPQSPAADLPASSEDNAPITNERPGKVRTGRLALVVGIAICAVALAYPLFEMWKRVAGNGGPQQTVAAASVETVVQPSRSPAPDTASQVTQPAPPAVVKRRAEIRATESTWVSAVVDGKEVLGKLLAKSDVREIEFSDKALVRVGNAAGVEISLDGQPIGPLGSRGRIRLVELSASGHRFLPVN